MIKGQIISGEFGKIIVRQKSDVNLELGELLIADNNDSKVLMQVFDLQYASQISKENLELISGMNLEENSQVNFFEPNIRNYTLGFLKPMISIKNNTASLCKTLPSFFSTVRKIKKEDLVFLAKPSNAIFLGKLRSGSETINDIDIFLDGENVFTHHVLIGASTGKGKSNLCSVMLYYLVDKEYCGLLVLDPHDEYYGRNGIGLKDHPKKENVVYYTPKNVPPGARTLKINISNIKPKHFHGVINFSDPQAQALQSYYKKYGKDWISAIALDQPIENYVEGTIMVVKRTITNLLSLKASNAAVYSDGVFDTQAGETTVTDIVNELEKSKTVIIDTSSFSGNVEILIGSLITHEIFSRYKRYKEQGINNKPVISVVLEEAPRVLGKEVLEHGPNIFSTIAREGRKFKVGLTAITQLPSLIPKEILANINTKIILGIEINSEREAIIESASQDLSNDGRNIASLDKGEAIITSNFSRFAIPIKVPLFKEYVKINSCLEQAKPSFSGIKI